MPTRALWLLRHAKAVADPPDGGSDFDRVLAPRGRRDAAALSAFIGRHGKRLGLGKVPLPRLALVSPAARTLATAELVLTGWATPPLVTTVPDLYGAEPEEVLELLRELDDELSAVMVVGHNPTAHSLASTLVAGSDPEGRDVIVRRGFPTCALGVYAFDLPAWREMGTHSARLAGLFMPPYGDS